MKLTGKTEEGDIITDLGTWFQLAPPLKKEKHWKDYRSAKELARAWCREGSPACPEELISLLETNKRLRGFRPEQAVAEMGIRFDKRRGGSRNADLAVWGKSGKYTSVVITVEAKADEPFGPTIGSQLKSGDNTPNSKKADRARDLVSRILNCEIDENLIDLPYQLLPGLAATLELAKEKKASVAVFVIHEFISLTLNFDAVVQNTVGLDKFLRMIPGWQTRHLSTGKLLPLMPLKSWPDIEVSVGKMRTLIPLDSGGRSTVLEDRSRQFLKRQ